MTLAFEAKPPPLSTGLDGVIRIAGTRVPLETVVIAFDAGATAEEIAQQYPSLGLAVVYATITYILQNRQTVDEYVAQRRTQGDALQAKIEQSSEAIEGTRLALVETRETLEHTQRALLEVQLASAAVESAVADLVEVEMAAAAAAPVPIFSIVPYWVP